MEIKVDGNVDPKGDGKKRYSAQEKLLILSQITKDKTIEEVAEEYNLAVGSLKRWQKKRDEAKDKEDPLG